MKRGWKPCTAPVCVSAILLNMLQSIPQWKEDGNISFTSSASISVMIALQSIPQWKEMETLNASLPNIPSEKELVSYNQYLNEKRMETGMAPLRVASTIRSGYNQYLNEKRMETFCSSSIWRRKALKSSVTINTSMKRGWKQEVSGVDSGKPWLRVTINTSMKRGWKPVYLHATKDSIIITLQSIPQWKEDGNPNESKTSTK